MCCRRCTRPADVDALPERMSDALTGHDSLSVSIIGPDGRTLFATPGAHFPEAVIRDASPAGLAHVPPLASWEHDGHAVPWLRDPRPDGRAGAARGRGGA